MLETDVGALDLKHCCASKMPIKKVWEHVLLKNCFFWKLATFWINVATNHKKFLATLAENTNQF